MIYNKHCIYSSITSSDSSLITQFLAELHQLLEMSLKKPTTRLCSSCSTYLSYGSLFSSTSSLSTRRRDAYQRSQRSQRRREYATVHHDSGNGGSDPQSYQWPKISNPSPYEILGIHRGATYTKRRFYELVKIYHPDRHDQNPSLHNLPQNTKLERYRLIVAANDLLSDPDKRRLYDSHGIGWTPTGTNSSSYQDRESMRRANRTWRHNPQSAAHNATWEDWERWYQSHHSDPNAQPGSQQQQQYQYYYQRQHFRNQPKPMYMSNGMFASLVVMMCMIGALAQRTRAESVGERIVDFRDRNQSEAGEEMRRRIALAAATGNTRDMRVDMFLKDRENATYNYSPKKYEESQPERPERITGP